ncbi:hypothetical protein MTO98_07395 [Mucilaginibacter sp. SMC90]|uniref:hypothetical protein n=1 Tax=Mucilaginibacter sp. SMC90 TaxID=2929803 RepID=UPI001FB4ECE8|nr:hypothetical protein [Mucilaginibacter sp. SMC90]UOE50901.1 hypothetical protein MTO98_07395 [Mucilaginibacter sp. SMC90]
MSHHDNLVRIKVVYDALEEIATQVAFVGGATVSLYADRATQEVRPTDDIDILIELASYNGYSGVEEKLRGKGFVNDWESGVICRYKVKGIVVDVMPTSDNVLGFANRWYPDGFANATIYEFDGYAIRIFSAAYFLATKLEAFKDRGNDDGRMSTDFEDIVYLLNNRSAIWDELRQLTGPIKDYIVQTFKELLDNKYIDEWVSAHLDYAEQERQYFIIGAMEEIITKK